MEKFIEILTTAAIYVIIALFALIFTKVFPILKNYILSAIENIKDARLRKFVKDAVLSIENDFKDKMGAGMLKKAAVEKQAKEFADEIGLKITEEQISILIQGVFEEADSAGLVNKHMIIEEPVIIEEIVEPEEEDTCDCGEDCHCDENKVE